MENVKKQSSFEKINYLFRPRKQIERKIIIEILLELSNKFIKLPKYEYVGMGSIYYYDFILFHKFLDMNLMTSIDDKITSKRFKFNKPYEFISFKNQKSTDYLSTRIWDTNSFLWMDYDFELDPVMLDDFGIISKSIREKDILIFTIDARCRFNSETKEKFLENFEEFISPQFKKEKYFTPLFFPNLIENICLNYFKEQMLYEEIKFHKLFGFTYEDGAKMYTLGGIFSKVKSLPKLKNPFARNNTSILNIDIPLITYKEKFYLDSKILNLKNNIAATKNSFNRTTIQKGSDKEKIYVSNKLNLSIELSIEDIEAYVKYYKYYPQYYEGII